ncbi:unnamed protein product [Protopolystoma xenopodis]|uniref:Uncharacterized protein n=1 Tax=Protopolystoma xenopodis TaxID=117903 RepID=A0A448XJD3_9PLAT|nr:unnamed protein product [Protopolystoma xenopodis]
MATQTTNGEAKLSATATATAMVPETGVEAVGAACPIFFKKPPTSFVSSQDWSLYVRICCHLRQVKTQFGLSEEEASKWLPSGSANRRKSSCILRLVASFNRLYCEYANVCDSYVRNLASSSSSSSLLAAAAVAKALPVASGLGPACPRCRVNRKGDRVYLCRRHRRPSGESGPGPDLAGGDRGACFFEETPEACTDKTLLDGPPSASTLANTETTSILLNSPHPSLVSRSASQFTQTSPGLGAVVLQRSEPRRPNTSPRPNTGSRASCFDWCFAQPPCPAGGCLGPEGREARREDEYYDEIRRQPNRASIHVFQCRQLESRLEHRARVPATWLPRAEGASRDSLVSIRLPIALELLLPRMQRQIEEVMSACRFIFDPLEVAAELRLSNYTTDGCIHFFERTRLLRDVIQEFLPKRPPPQAARSPDEEPLDAQHHQAQQQCRALAGPHAGEQKASGDGEPALLPGPGDSTFCLTNEEVAKAMLQLQKQPSGRVVGAIRPKLSSFLVKPTALRINGFMCKACDSISSLAYHNSAHFDRTLLTPCPNAKPRMHEEEEEECVCPSCAGAASNLDMPTIRPSCHESALGLLGRRGFQTSLGLFLEGGTF